MSAKDLNSKASFWKKFTVLYGLGLFGLAAGMPYILALADDYQGRSSEPLPFPLPVMLLIAFLQNALLLGVAVGVGLKMARAVGLGIPVIERWLRGGAVNQELRAILLPSVIAGIAVGVGLLLLLVFVFISLAPDLRIILVSDVEIWKKFLASFYGGIFEEILMRLFLVSLLTWVLARIMRTENSRAAPFWVASGIVAVIFGLGHLGAASLMLTITPMVVAAALILNGVAALTFSYLYRKHGLEAAIIAHFCADIVLHVIGSAMMNA